MSIILGIDPGSRVTGFGLIRFKDSEPRLISYGTIKTSVELPFAYRLRELSEGLEAILTKYRPEYVAIEKIFMGKNADSAFKLGHARGVVMAEAAKSGSEVFEYATRVVKKTLTGKGSGDKEQVQRMVESLLGVSEIKPLDATDALALALHHVGILRQGPRRILQENCL
jgi:crossover junction endodeoxyribonuclease RuvC